MRAFVAKALARLPAMPDGPDSADVVAQTLDRSVPGGREATFYVRLDLRTQSEDEAALRGLREIPGSVSRDRWAAWEGDGHRRAKLYARGAEGRSSQGQEGIVGRFVGPNAAEAQPLGHFGGMGCLFEVVGL